MGTLCERRRRGHTPIEARVTHLFRKVGELLLLEVVKRLEIVDPLVLDVRSTDDKDPILDILPIVQGDGLLRDSRCSYMYRRLSIARS
jgi:hypothetical protein